MANVLNFNPYKVDTVMTSSFFNSTPIIPALGPLQLLEIYWLNPLTVGDTFVVTDGHGNVIKTGRCEAAGQSQIFQMYGKKISDFQVTTLASGVLYIEWEA
jgi:hypothetical protein